MQTINQRLTEARKRAGYITATEAAEAHGWTVSTYLAHENGTRGVPIDKARKYAAAYRVGLDWLANGSGEPLAADETDANRLQVIKGIKLGLSFAGIAPETRDWYEAIAGALREYDALAAGKDSAPPAGKPHNVGRRSAG